jgi:uncharacterized protein (DUF952 family)
MRTTTAAALFKILDREAWERSEAVVQWAPVDRADGFVHLSAAHQVRETAARHFAGRSDLVLVEILPDRLAPGTLRWEPSRGGDLFPHVYGDVPIAAVGRSAALSTVAGSGFPDWDSLASARAPA